MFFFLNNNKNFKTKVNYNKTKKNKKQKKSENDVCRDMICSPSPKWLGCKPNEPNTINLQRVCEKVELLANEITTSKDLKYEQAQKQM